MERLTGLDAAFLALESPTNHMHWASMLVVDPAGVAGPWPSQAVTELVSRRLPLLAPLRRRLVDVPFGVNQPLWVEDAPVDMSFHVRRAAVPRPGGPVELAELVADLMGRPLDRRRPLWQMHVIEGLEDDRVAVVVRIHHCAMDGASGAELLLELLGGDDITTEDGAGGATAPETVPPDSRLFEDAVAALPGTEGLTRAVQRTVATVMSLRQRNATSEEAPPPSPFRAPRTSLNVRIGPWRRVAWARIAREDLALITTALGGTANDVVLAVCSGALRAYLDDRGEQPGGDLTALVPVSVRTRADRGSPGNRLSPMLVSLASRTDGAADRLRSISAGTARARAQDRAVPRDVLTEWTELVVPALATPAARLGSRLLSSGVLPPAFNVIVSNVPGPRTPLFLAGAPVTELYPLGPVLDTVALNITVMTYLDHLHVGVVVDRDAVADAADISRRMEPVLEELRKEAEGSGRR